MLQILPSRLGRALRGVRADEVQLVFHDSSLRAVPADIHVSSSGFPDHGPLPKQYTADGQRLSPPLSWSGIPPEAVSLILLVEDADSPTPQPLVHAIVWGLAAENGGLAAGALPHSGERLPAGTSMGRNSLLTVGYLSPDPPSGHGTHRYAFQVFALDSRPRYETAPGRHKVMEWLRGHAIAKGMLVGLYERP